MSYQFVVPSPVLRWAHRFFVPASALALVLLIGGCATNVGHSSGRLARETPESFIGIKPENVIVGVDMDSRVPATPGRGPDFRVGVFPVDHDAWAPIGGRLRMRPLNMLGDKPDKGAGERMKSWINSPPGRLRLAYVLTKESQEELVRIQEKFRDHLKKHPPGGKNRGVLRVGADTRYVINADQKAGASIIQTWLQLHIGEGPFKLWQGRIDQMR